LFENNSEESNESVIGVINFYKNKFKLDRFRTVQFTQKWYR